ncbi:hypothetical protein ES708_26961 [subsurface metagenome]
MLISRKNPEHMNTKIKESGIKLSENPLRHSRREFIQGLSLSGIGMAGLGTFIQSCAEKEIPLTTNLAEAYLNGVLSIIKKIRERELVNITRAASLAVQARLQGYKLYAYLSGGMLSADTVDSRPGCPDVFITTDIGNAAKDDVIVTNNPEAVRGFGERYVKVIGITTPFIPNNNTPDYALDNMGVLRIEDVSDIVIYCHIPHTDGMLNVQDIEIPICPASGIIHSMVYFSLVSEIVDGLTKSGIYPKIG